ncbi:MAG: DegT/DnrJ/EryC1/StrS family aminotransferase [Alphaproteobacteria bacterium]
MSLENKNIYVSEPSLPELNQLIPYLQKIWESKYLTNNGQFHQELEQKLCDYLGVKYISLFSNGTLALITAMQHLNLAGEVITTPFSFVATTHSLFWNNLSPVFVDVEPDTFNLDPDKIEAAITPKTSAIMPVHVYGNPCNVYRIQEIADKHKLKVIYDACHTFGVTLKGIPVLNFGDLSVMSFHATKVYNTFEGGAIISHTLEDKKRIDKLKNFGFTGEITLDEIGLNAKVNEFSAALGILQLTKVDEYILKRKEIAYYYREKLKEIAGISYFNDFDGVKHCYSYFPILIDEKKLGKSRDDVYEELKAHNIFSRRYFYPLISQFEPYKNLPSAAKGKMPVAEKIAEEVLCLPLHPNLTLEDCDKITKIIKS